jgi:dihydroorotate dehydrogenase
MDPATLQEGSVDPKAIEGNPRPPFRTLKEQTDWLNAQGSRLYAVNPILKATWR